MFIPNTIHLSWKSNDLMTSSAALVKYGVQNLAKLNPYWTIEVNDDEQIDQYLKDNVDKSDYKLFEDAHIVAKTDIWRLVKLYQQGGIYMDVDRFCNVKLDQVIKPDVRCVLPTYRDSDFSHDLMITDKGNPIFLTAYQMNIERRRQGHTNVYLLGPQTYMHAVTYTLTGQIIDSNPPLDVFNQLREIINNNPVLDTYREQLPGDSFLFRNQELPGDYETMKRELYALYGMQHWTGEW